MRSLFALIPYSNLNPEILSLKHAFIIISWKHAFSHSVIENRERKRRLLTNLLCRNFSVGSLNVNELKSEKMLVSSVVKSRSSCTWIKIFSAQMLLDKKVCLLKYKRQNPSKVRNLGVRYMPKIPHDKVLIKRIVREIFSYLWTFILNWKMRNFG